MTHSSVARHAGDEEGVRDGDAVRVPVRVPVRDAVPVRVRLRVRLGVLVAVRNADTLRECVRVALDELITLALMEVEATVVALCREEACTVSVDVQLGLVLPVEDEDAEPVCDGDAEAEKTGREVADGRYWCVAEAMVPVADTDAEADAEADKLPDSYASSK